MFRNLENIERAGVPPVANRIDTARYGVRLLCSPLISSPPHLPGTIWAMADSREEVVTIPRHQLESLLDELDKSLEQLDEVTRQRAHIKMMKMRLEQLLMMVDRKPTLQMSATRQSQTFQAVRDPRREPED